MWILKLLSLYLFGRLLFWVYNFIRSVFFLRKANFAKLYGPHTWAIVTGASDGIGLAICEKLASEGFNIVMIARNWQKLEAAKKAVISKNALCDILIISKDFTEASNAEFFTEIEQKIEGLDVSILVNNVGVMPPAKNLDYTTEMVRDTVVVNCHAQLGMTKLIVPKLLKRAQRSALIDVSSGMTSVPDSDLLSLYQGTKWFNRVLSNGWSGLLASKVDVLCLTPGFVSTNLNTFIDANHPMRKISCSKEECAEGTLLSLTNLGTTSGAFIHRLTGDLIEGVFSLIPSDVQTMIMRRFKPPKIF